MKKLLSDYFMLFAIASVLVILDQLTKSWVRLNLAFGEVYHPEWWLSQFVRLVHVKNTGAAFGMLQSFGGVFMILSFVISCVIIYYFPQIPRQDWVVRVAMGMMLGGALGNLVDRLQIGHVTDFFSVGGFPVFNIADASISVGVVVLFIGLWIQENRQKSQAQAQAQQPDSSSSNLDAPSVPEESQGE